MQYSFIDNSNNNRSSSYQYYNNVAQQQGFEQDLLAQRSASITSSSLQTTHNDIKIQQNKIKKN